MMQTSEQTNEISAALLEDGYWSGVLGFSRYLISANGRIISLQKKRARLMRPALAGKYRAVFLAGDDSVLHRFYVHRLVLMACDRDPETDEEARHLNGDREDNRIDNLRWGTRGENAADRILHGTTAAGARNPNARLTLALVSEMRRLYESGGWTFKQLAARFGVTAMTAHRAIRRQSWTTI